MGLELLTQADYVLNTCGRPVPPPGFKFVDLPRIIPFHHTPQGSCAGGVLSFSDESGHGFTMTMTASALLPSYNVVINLINDTFGAPPKLVSIVGNTITLQINANPYITNAAGIAFFNAIPQLAALVTFGLFNTASAANPFGDMFSPPSSNGPFAVNGYLCTFTEGWPTQDRVENTANTLFICMGIMLQTDPVSVRIKWPNGRYWNQTPSGNPFQAQSAGFPQGTGGNLYALDEEVYIERGGKVAIEMSGPNIGNVDVHLWGKLRYLLKDKGGAGSVDGQTCIVGYPAAANSQGPPACLIGYPVNAGSSQSGLAIKMINDPIQVLKYRTRFPCWPNGNIFAPEFRLGNQCETDTPPGYQDDAFTFFSGVTGTNVPTPYAIPGGGQLDSQAIAIPGQDDIVIRRWRAIVTWSGGATGLPVVQLRLPNGYSVTGGDQIPVNLGYWIPCFPTLRIAQGTVLIVDLADSIQESSAGTINVVLEFDAVKRRKIQT